MKKLVIVGIPCIGLILALVFIKQDKDTALVKSNPLSKQIEDLSKQYVSIQHILAFDTATQNHGIYIASGPTKDVDTFYFDQDTLFKKK